jgi:hypothetical protein
MNKHLDRIVNASKNALDKAKTLVKPGPHPQTLVKQMVAEQARWNDLFSTKLIEALEKVETLDEKEGQLRRDCTEKIAEVEDKARNSRVELTKRVAALEAAGEGPRLRQRWIWACSLAALLLALSALVISLRGLR